MSALGPLLTLNPHALPCGLATLSLFTPHGAVFLALKTKGELRERAVRAVRVVGPAALIVGGFFLVLT